MSKGRLDGGQFVAIRSKGAIQRQLQTVFNLGTIGELTDGQLLERFGARGGEAAELAFAALVERHGPMVLRVCRHVLADPNDADDSFQATFLILVKKARSLWVQESLGPWLHRVAHRVATRARISAARLREHEKRAAGARPTLLRERGDRDELLSLLHEEIDRLPEPYRVPVVLCDLQGLTHERAARHLRWPLGTVKSRLARGRELLRGRLSRRGLGLPAGVTICETALGGPCRAGELVPPNTLVEPTLRAMAAIAEGKARAFGMISSRVAILIEEVLRTMVVTKLKLASVCVLLIGAAGAAGVLAQQGPSSGASLGGQQIRQASGVGSAHAPAPAYITQSRAMIVTRLEEEVKEARARLERTLRKFPSPDDPAAVRARETLEALVQRLDRIDRVLVDVVETYPTMVDFSRGPSDADITSQVGLGAIHRESGGASHRLGDDLRSETGPARVTDRGESKNSMLEQREASPAEPVDATNRRRRRQKTDEPDDSGKQGQSGKPQGRDAPGDADKSGQKSQSQEIDKPDDAGRFGQKSQSQNRDTPDDAGKSGQQSQSQNRDTPDDAGKSGQQSQSQNRDTPDDAGKFGQKSQSQNRDAPDDAGKSGQKSQSQKSDKQDDAGRFGQKSQSQKSDKQDDAGKSGQKSQPQHRDDQKNPGQQGQKSGRGEPREKDVQREGSKPRAGGHGSGVVAADLNDDGLIDLFIVNGDNERLGPKRQSPRADASKDASKQRQNSQPQPDSR
jgi:RNA polymerase sigma factor (sigma-70 family)